MASGAISAAQSVIKAHGVGIKARQFGAQQWRGVPASGVGPGDLKSNSGVCERSLGAARSIDPVFYPDSSGVTQVDKRRQGLERFTSR